MSELFQEIYQSLLHGKELAVATVISNSGSTPRSCGSNMLVYRDGSISGTIGGGIVEGEVIQSALRLFETHGAVISSYNLNQTDMDDMDLVCGGQMQILIEHLSSGRENLAMFGLVCEEIKQARPFFWVGKVTEKGKQWQIERAVQTTDNRWFGTVPKGPDLLKIMADFNVHCGKTALIESDKHHYIVAAIRPPDTVYIFGAGHVSKEMAVLTKQVGFRTVVFDDRADFANTKRFPDVDGVFVCSDFSSVFDEFSVTSESYIVIVTRGHRSDKEVLNQALRTKAAYVGMIGSRKKRKSVYQTLINEGVEPSALEQVYCPIGLSIEAETPAEIAVSVVAQLIQHRANHKKHD